MPQGEGGGEEKALGSPKQVVLVKMPSLEEMASFRGIGTTCLGLPRLYFQCPLSLPEQCTEPVEGQGKWVSYFLPLS
jgi:hypothetical protein